MRVLIDLTPNVTPKGICLDGNTSYDILIVNIGPLMWA